MDERDEIPGGGDPQTAYEEGFESGLQKGRKEQGMEVGGGGDYPPPGPSASADANIASEAVGGGGPYKPPDP